jgi:hypothetical protein
VREKNKKEENVSKDFYIHRKSYLAKAARFRIKNDLNALLFLKDFVGQRRAEKIFQIMISVFAVSLFCLIWKTNVPIKTNVLYKYR